VGEFAVERIMRPVEGDGARKTRVAGSYGWNRGSGVPTVLRSRARFERGVSWESAIIVPPLLGGVDGEKKDIWEPLLDAREMVVVVGREGVFSARRDA